MQPLGCKRVVQDRILNHVNSSVAAIYDRHRYDKEARTWLQKWAAHMDALTGGFHIGRARRMGAPWWIGAAISSRAVCSPP